MFLALKLIIGVIAIVIILAVLTPVLEIVMPNTASNLPGAIQDDMDHISSSVEEQAGQVIDTVSGTVSDIIP